jgi:single-strand DNA-binding protein
MNCAQAVVVGRLTADPKLCLAKDGGCLYCRFSVAVNERRGEEEIVNYYDVSAFGDLAERIIGSLRKGQGVIVVGRLNTYKEPYTTDDGRETHRTRIGITASTAGPDLSCRPVQAGSPKWRSALRRLSRRTRPSPAAAARS